VNIAVSSANWFLVGGPGNDAIQAFGGYNVLDGGTGSNFLTGGSGTDTFFVNDINPSADTWTTVNNFHNDDDVTLFGIDPGKDILQWADNQGASGFTGLTLHAFSPNGPTASLTMVGYNTTDLSNGTLSVQFSTESNGTPFMHIVGV
jgi:serralysin